MNTSPLRQLYTSLYLPFVRRAARGPASALTHTHTIYASRQHFSHLNKIYRTIPSSLHKSSHACDKFLLASQCVFACMCVDIRIKHNRLERCAHLFALYGAHAYARAGAHKRAKRARAKRGENGLLHWSRTIAQRSSDAQPTLVAHWPFWPSEPGRGSLICAIICVSAHTRLVLFARCAGSRFAFRAHTQTEVRVRIIRAIHLRPLCAQLFRSH